MGKFIPSEHVERLEYDFTEYGGSTGTITEPSTGAVNGFFKSMKSMMKEVNALKKVVEDLDIEEMDSDALAERMAKVDEAEAGASIFQQRTIELIAELCGAKRVENEDGSYTVTGGSPSVDDLSKLPYRVLQAFNGWLVREISPKKATPGMKG